MAATIGDFDADGNLELAGVSNDLGGEHGSDPGAPRLWSQVCRLILDSPGQWQLECLDAFPVGNLDMFPSVDVAAGKIFRPDAAEFLVIVTSPVAASSSDHFNVNIVGFDEELAPPGLDLWQSFPSDYPAIGGTYGVPGVHEVRVATGLFRYDLPNGYDFGDRQFVTAALGVTSGSQTATLWFWDMNPTPERTAGRVFATAQTSTSGKHTAKPSLAVGNFVGHGVAGDQSDPTMQAGLTYLLTTSDDLTDGTKVTQPSWIWKLVPPLPGSNSWSTLRAWNHSFATNYGFNGYDPFMITADYDGDSWRLGIPFHILINGFTGFNSLLEEPPKHVDYLPVDPDDLSKGFDVVNLSGYKRFKVQLKESTTQSLKTGRTDTTSWDLGVGLDVSHDYQENVEKFLILRKKRVDEHHGLKVSGHFQHTVKDINSAYHQTIQTWTNSTDTDDQLDVSIQDTDIWRYPIIGFETEDTSNPMGYYEVAIPGHSFSEQTGGTQKEWYTPLHVNNNILSYPQNLRTGLPWLPSDLGSFEKPKLECPGGASSCPDDQKIPVVDPGTGNPVMEEVTILMADEVKYTWDGNEHTQEIQFNEGSATSREKTFTSTLSASLSWGLGISSQMKVPKGGDELAATREVKADFNLSPGISASGDDIASTELSGSTGITLSVPAISGFTHEGRSYSFTTAVYASATQGDFKVAHSILDLISEPQDWWVKQYGRAPDPALNLPFRLLQHDADPQHANLEWWTLRTADNDYSDIRHEMRGFFMRNNYRDEVTENYELVSERNRVDGDTVQLCVRVHNFSLGVAAGNFDADFYYYAWNKRTGKEVDKQTGEEVDGPKLVWIGKANVGSLDSLSTAGAVTMREVCVPWDTTGLSQVADPDIGYRFLVNLDESDEVRGEIHELKDAEGNEALGGNNSGRWPWSDAIMVRSAPEASAAARGLRLVNGALQDTSLDVNFRLSEGGIAIKDATGFLEGDAVELTAGEDYGLRAHMVSETPYSGNIWVAFFDGKPREGGKLIALEHSGGLRQGDNYAWAHWTPKTAGEHELRAYAFHRVSHANREGGTTSRAVAVVQAEVTPTPTPPAPAGGDDDGCSLAAGSGSEASGSASLVLLGLFWLALKAFGRFQAR